MYTLKSLVRRGLAFGGAAALVIAAVAPMATPALADALNPLTDRSLTLSSSSPGWAYTDGSGNTTYAPPNSGANGQKTGNTFSFKVSSNGVTGDPVHAMTFQYCTTSAGECTAPGDNVVHGTDTATTSDLNVNYPSAQEVSTADFGTIVDTTDGVVQQVPSRDDSQGNFVVFYNDGGTWTQSDGWTLTASNVEDLNGDETGQNNYITLSMLDTDPGLAVADGTEVKVVFFGTDANYITNPGSGAFFVKINTYAEEAATTVIDGGVTVANVMNQSIQITTKVLETMQFSVGTVDPNTLESNGAAGSQLHTANGNTSHGVCDPILMSMNPLTDPDNVLQLGNQTGESSLSVENTYSTHSYWRLSSNSSAGATVYYSGVTLSNTVGDEIAPIGATKTAPLTGMEQFGLAIANGSIADNPAPAPGSHLVDYDVERDSGSVFENGADNATNGLHDSTLTDLGGVYDTGTSTWDMTNINASWHTPQLYPLIPTANYDQGAGIVNSEYVLQSGDPGYQAGVNDSINTAFAFEPSSNLIPVAIASQDQQVVDCVTAKMRYIANIAATTPAGVYTTMINYIAAPQY